MASPIAPPFNPEQVSSLIESDINSCQALLDLLEKERNALAERDMDALEDVIQHKTTQLQQLERSAHIRAVWVASNGAPTDQPDEAWLKALEGFKPNVKERWHKLKALLKSCQAENEVNGRAITRNHQTFSKLLNIMRGQTDAPNLYTAFGGKSAKNNKSHLGEA